MSLLRRLALPFVLPFVVAIATAIVLEAVVADTLRAQAEAARTDEVVQAVDQALASVVDAETAERGFALTGAGRYEAEYADAVARAEAAFDRLEELGAGGPDGRALEEMRRAFAAWREDPAADVFVARRRAPVGFARRALTAHRLLLDEQRRWAASGGSRTMDLRDVEAEVDAILELPLPREVAAAWREVRARLEIAARLPSTQAAELRRQVGRLADEAQEAAASVTSGIVAGAGRRHIDEIRRQGVELRAAQRERFASERQRVADAAALARTAAWAGPLGVALLGFLGVALLQWRVGRSVLRLSEAATAVSQGRLDVRTTPRERDPLRHVGRAFDQMAARIQQRTTMAAAERRAGTSLQTARSKDEAYRLVAGHVQAQLPDTAGSILLLDQGRGDMRVAHRWGDVRGDVHASVFAPHDCWAVRRDGMHVSAGGAPRCHHVASERDGVCVPLRAPDAWLGVLCLETDRGHLGAEVREAAEGVAEQLSLTLSALSSRETLQAQSVRDALTGLYNRRYLDETLAQELARTERDGRPTSLLMVDLDHFKRLNDAYGHPVGDDVLRAIGRVLGEQVRAGDVPARVGGEEFALILPGVPHDTALARADQVRCAIRDTPLPDISEPLTASLGVATAPQQATTREELFAVADAALYHAKRAGRDRVASAREVGAP